MKRMILLLLILTLPLMAASDLVLPWATDMVWHSDTLHVTTAEQGWAIGTTTGAYWLTVINPNANYLLIRFSNVAGILQTYLGNYGTGEYHQPYSVGSAIDSVFIDGSVACTVYIEWWSVD